jgi:transcriptional regulator with XRE-family HTH domain
MDKVHIKIKKARLLLSLTQSQVKDLCGVEQDKISNIENGKTKFIPNEYIEFLHINGIDLNSIFDDSFDVKMLNTENALKEPIPKYSKTEKCFKCEEKEKLILSQQKTINTQSEFIDLLKDTIQDKSKADKGKVA